ncbi:hypothetical protein FNV43_RR15754 [Rhamnella rubrinervis]|uniref:Uncharacterized protein n=1 Tax=Rhamnella rubrinervis TaxID=2594499 RepID=A0A8K0E9H3_9ROSA|nr:hypothetical protein FNV43_RR15754 [Rhamnella rubrinervis]
MISSKPLDPTRFPDSATWQRHRNSRNKLRALRWVSYGDLDVVRSCSYGDLDAVRGDESGYVYYGNEVAR